MGRGGIIDDQDDTLGILGKVDDSSCEVIDKLTLYSCTGGTLGLGSAMDFDGQNLEWLISTAFFESHGSSSWCLPSDACANRAMGRSKVALHSEGTPCSVCLRWTLPSQCCGCISGGALGLCGTIDDQDDTVDNLGKLDVSSCEALDKWALYSWNGRTLGFGNAMDADGQNFELPLLRRSSAQDPLIWRMQTGNQGGLRIEFSPEPPVGISKTMRNARDRGRGLANWCLPGDACANRAVDRSKVALSSDRLRWTLPSQCSCPVENDDADLMFFCCLCAMAV